MPQNTDNTAGMSVLGLKRRLAGKADDSALDGAIFGVPTELEMEGIEPAVVTEALRKVEQVLTPAEQEHVKKNLGISKMALFCDLFNAAAGAYGHARITDDGLFDCELNGLRLTYEEAVGIYTLCIGMYAIGSDKAQCCSPYPYRTAMPFRRISAWSDISGLFNDYNTPLEVVAFESSPHGPFNVSAFYETFHRCQHLREVRGELRLQPGIRLPYSGFYVCYELEEIRLTGVDKDISFAYSPKLSPASLEHLVNNAANTAPITVSVHPDVLVKLTDPGNTGWHALLSLAAGKNITFATA